MSSFVKAVLARRVSFSMAFVMVGAALGARAVENAAVRAAGLSAFANAPLYFEKNAGQLEGGASYIARGAECSVLLAPTEAEILLGKTSGETFVRGGSSAHVVRLQLLGANAASAITGRDQMPARANYFIGSEPAQWHTGVPLFSKVQVDEVYPGVQVIYYANQSAQLEYDFLLQPGARADQIRFHIEGANSVQVDQSGNLVLQIDNQEIRQHQPVVYQEIAGARKEVSASYHLNADGSVGFALAEYDHRLPLVIDPVLDFLTYMGGKKLEIGWALALDQLGNVYVAGETLTTGLPTTNSIEIVVTNKTGQPINTNFNKFRGGNNAFGDAFVAKYDPNGALQFLTYLGGKTDDGALGIAYDANSDAVWITGFTDSTNFPLQNPNRSHLTGQNKNSKKIFPVDAFITKLGPLGTNLLFSTLFGADGLDEGVAIHVDNAGGVYVTGLTSSSNLIIIPPNAYQPTNGGDFDAFVTKLVDMGGGLYTNVYTTYLGGTNTDYGLSIAVDSAKDAWITGLTFSEGLHTVAPLTLPPGTNSFFPNGHTFDSLNAGTNTDRRRGFFHSDAFVAEVNPDGTIAPFVSYLGGSNDDVGQSIAIDNADNVFVAGYTLSPDFPTNVFTTQTTNMFGLTNVIIPAVTNFASHPFVTQITGGELAFSTHFGGDAGDLGTGVAVDGNGLVYVTGSVGSTNFFAQKMLVITNYSNFHTNNRGVITYPGFLTNNPSFFNLGGTNSTKLRHGGNTNDVFVAVLSPHLTNIIYSILIGGPGRDQAHAIAVDNSGDNVFVVGETTSITNLVTTNAAQTRFGGGGKSGRQSDAFVGRIRITPVP